MMIRRVPKYDKLYDRDSVKITDILESGNLSRLIDIAYRIANEAKQLDGSEQKKMYKRGSRYIKSYMRGELVDL